jgi:hypothetical protein
VYEGIDDPDGSAGPPHGGRGAVAGAGPVSAEVVGGRVRDQDVLVSGSGSVVDQLVAHDPVDGATGPSELELELVWSEGAGVSRQVHERQGKETAQCDTHS